MQIPMSLYGWLLLLTHFTLISTQREWHRPLGLKDDDQEMSKSLTSSFKKLEGKFNSAQSRRENIMDGGDWDKPKEKLKDLNKKIRDEVNAQQHQTAIGKSNSKTSPIFFGKHAPQKDDFFGSDQDTSVTAYSDGADMQNSKNGDKDSDSEAEQKIKEELDKSMANLMAAMKDSKFDKK